MLAVLLLSVATVAQVDNGSVPANPPVPAARSVRNQTQVGSVHLAPPPVCTQVIRQRPVTARSPLRNVSSSESVLRRSHDLVRNSDVARRKKPKRNDAARSSPADQKASPGTIRIKPTLIYQVSGPQDPPLPDSSPIVQPGSARSNVVTNGFEEPMDEESIEIIQSEPILSDPKQTAEIYAQELPEPQNASASSKVSKEVSRDVLSEKAATNPEKEIVPTPIGKAQPSEFPPRTTPPTVTDFHQPLQWNMSLGEAIYIALENNPKLQIDVWVPRLARTKLTQEFARFDPTVDINHHWASNVARARDTIDIFGTGSTTQGSQTYGSTTGNPDQLAISKNLLSGGSVRGALSTGYQRDNPAGSFNALNPSWRSSAALQFSQPLKRGRGRNITTIPIRVAATNYKGTEWGFQGVILDTVRQVEMAYWGLVFSKQNLEVRRQETEEARKTYQKEQEKLALGQSSRPELGEARLHYYRNVALYQQRKTELLEAERQFRAVLGIPGFDEYRINVDLPDEPPEIDVDWDESVQKMLHCRPDILASRFTLESSRLNYVQMANLCLPDINLEGRVAKSGLDRRFDGSVARLFEDEDLNWMLGVSYSGNIHNCRIKAEVRRASYAYAQQKAITRQLEYDSVHRLQNSYERLHHRRDKVRVQRAVREAAEERLAAYTEKFELGELPIELYLRAVAANSDAELQERRARVELMQSMAEFEYVRGTLLTARSVILGQQEEDRIVPGEDREGSLLELGDPKDLPEAPKFPPFDEFIRDMDIPDSVRENMEKFRESVEDE